MPISIVGIIGGGQLGSMLATAAKKINLKTVKWPDFKSVYLLHVDD